MPELQESPFEEQRREMVEQIALHASVAADDTRRPRIEERVMGAMLRVPRHEFVPAELRAFAYFDTPLPIGFDKTISQPYIVALMTDLLDLGPEDRVLEVGTGLGYQAAILAALARTVDTVEIVEELAAGAEARLQRLGYDNVSVRTGDGSTGWGERAPFDRIIVAAAPDLVPAALIRQLKPGGRMVLPAGLADAQRLMVVDKDETGRTRTRELLSVRFAELETVR